MYKRSAKNAGWRDHSGRERVHDGLKGNCQTTRLSSLHKWAAANHCGISRVKQCNLVSGMITQKRGGKGRRVLVMCVYMFSGVSNEHQPVDSKR